jgi:hypothetical protein
LLESLLRKTVELLVFDIVKYCQNGMYDLLQLIGSFGYKLNAVDPLTGTIPLHHGIKKLPLNELDIFVQYGDK